MDALTQTVRRIAAAAARTCGLLVVAMALAIAADVACRSLFGVVLLAGGVGELSGYALAIVTVWGASLTLLNRAHIRIDTLHMLVPRPVAAALDLLAAASFTLAAGLLAWMGWQTFARSLALGSKAMTPLATPLALPQGVWFAGLLFLTVTSAWLTLAAAILTARGRAAEARPLIGTRLVSEEIEEHANVSAKG
jgi:TRAP-type C4-dicarboxylate transport system permease small subunit